MQINITAETELFIKEKLAEGQYSCAQEIIDEAIRLLKEKEIIKKHRIAQVNLKLKAGMRSLKEGKFHSEKQIDSSFAKKFGF